MVDPATTYLDTDGRARARRALLPDTILGGPHGRARRGPVIGPDCQLVDTVVGRDAVVRQTVAREAVIGDACHRRPVRVAAARHAPRCRRARRHVRRDQEQRDRRGRQGAAPLLRGRRRCRARARTSVPGNITANYDGRNKHRTKIGKNVRSGSNTVFVAPVDVGDGAYTGAGAVVNRDVPPGALAKGVPARIDEGWRARSARMVGATGTRHTTRRTSSMELVSKKQLLLFAGRGHPELREEIAAEPRGAAWRRSSCRASPTARCTAATTRASAAPTSSCCRRTASRSTTGSWSSCIMIDAAKRASAKRITAVCPFYGYARQDRKAEGREPITRPAPRRHAHGGGRRPRRHRRPAHRPDPGLLRLPGRPPHRGAAARRVRGWARSRARTSPSSRPTPAAASSPAASRTASASTASSPSSPSSTSTAPRARTTSPVANQVVGAVEGRTCVLIDDMIDTGGTLGERIQAARGPRRRVGDHRGHPRPALGTRPSTG